MIGYGWAISGGVTVYGCNVLNGMMLGGGLICSTSVIVYALDAYRDSSNEIFIMNMFFKNFIYYGLSNFVNNWAAADGAGEVFTVFGTTGCALVKLPLHLSDLSVFWVFRFIFMESVSDHSGPDTICLFSGN